MKMAIPVKYEITSYNCINVEKLFAKFKNAVKNGLSDDTLIVEKYVYTLKSEAGEIKLITLNGTVEIKTADCEIRTNDYFVMTKPGMPYADSAPKLVIGDEVFDVENFVEFVKRGFRELLKRIADF